MREHTHLPAMVGFVRKHVAQHFRANRPRRSPAVSAKLLDAAPTTAERFSEHFRAASGAHAIIGGKDLECGSAELSVNLLLTRGHGSLLLDL
jgi:hypothetical protein